MYEAEITHKGRRRKKRHHLESDAHDWLDSILAEDSGRTVTNVTDITLGEVMTQWLADAKPRVVYGTFVERDSAVRIYLRPLLDTVKLREFGKAEARAARATIADICDESGKPLSVARRNRIWQVACMALNFAVAEGWVEKSPAAELGQPCREIGEVRASDKALEEEDVRRLVRWLSQQKCEGHYGHYPCPARIRVGLLGLRQGEVRALCWDSVDLKMGLITVRRTARAYDDGWRVDAGTKTGGRGVREIELPEGVVSALREHRATQPANATFVFSAAKDWRQPASKSTDQKRWLRTQSDARLGNHYELHGLRHTAATILAAESVPLAQAVLGHSNASTTFGYVMPRGVGARGPLGRLQ